MIDKIVWVVVSYGNADQAFELAANLTNINCDLEVIVGCNGAGDFKHLASNSTFDASQRIRVVDASHNPGYMGFLAELANQIPLEATVVLSNADLSVDEKFIDNLEIAIRDHPAATVFAPAIEGNGGKDQNPHMLRPPTIPKLRVLRALHRFPILTDLLGAVRPSGQSARSGLPGSSGKSIYAAHGSCMIFTPKYRGRGATFDYPMFLFGEELWVATEVRRTHGDIRYVPECRVTHMEHATTGTRRRGLVASAKYDSLRYWSRTLTKDGGRNSAGDNSVA